jgi:hypothetical protein
MRIGIIGAGAIEGTLAAISGVLAISESGPPDATSDLPQDHNRLAGRREGEGQAGAPHGGPGAGCEAGREAVTICVAGVVTQRPCTRTWQAEW